jgi:type I restriction-modification system DNA methylase subunit
VSQSQVPEECSRKSFLENFLGTLASPYFTNKGNLSVYLISSTDQRSDDERDIVDRCITALLIESLGYDKREVLYDKTKDGKRPDYVIKIEEYPRSACFIIEDKNTTELNITHYRPQLQGYMTQFGASRGMLINGHSILAYDQLEGGLQTPAIEIDLSLAVHAWIGDVLFANGKSKVEALDECGLLSSFSALWQRFGRSSFASLYGLIDDLTLQNETGNHKPHEINGSTWKTEFCRIPIISITQENAHDLTETIKGLIGEFEDDADAQLTAIDTDYKKYKTATERIPTESATLQAQEDSLVKSVLRMLPTLDQNTKDNEERLLRKIMSGEALVKELDHVESLLYSANSAKAKKDDHIQNLINEICAHTDKRFRYLRKLKAQHKKSIEVNNYFETWKEKTASIVFPSEKPEFLRSEFLSQTAYLVIIRILLVRIMEDKNLVNRMFTNGGIALWFREVEPHYLKHAMGRSADYLLEFAYTSAQHIYAHFYAEHTVLDWYVPDRNAVVKVLHKLAGFDLSKINRDIIGSVYGQYVEAKHKHESGMYFTPPDVVSFMLDRIGYKGKDIIDKKLVDLSCGSGGFLVEAAKRLVEAHTEYWRGVGEPHIPPEEIQKVLNDIGKCIHGIDLNPFACALAETNLLIQVIDIVNIAYKHDQLATIERFHIYNSDSLLFSADTRSIQSGTLPFENEDLPVEDQLKAGIGKWKDKFDYVVGNPPYIRADESPYMQSYRERIKREHISEAVRKTMVLKWDMFVPFVASSLNLLRPESEHSNAGRMAIITSNAIETVPYSSELRKLLVDTATVNEVHFFKGVKLFEDAMVQNTITIITNCLPNENTETERFWHNEAPKGEANNLRSQKLRQLEYKVDVFRQELPALEIAKGVATIPLADIFYISVGMVLNADEKTNKGAFKIEDLILDYPDETHCAAFVRSQDIGNYGIRKPQYLEYGEGTRVPGNIRRPTFPELYNRPKLMVGRFTGFAVYDDGTWDDLQYLKCNDSVFLLMPWCNLKGIDNRAIQSELKSRPISRELLETISAKIDPWYATAFLNSTQMEALLAGVSRSSNQYELKPNDFREISIPFPDDHGIMQSAARLAKRASMIQQEIMKLRKEGWIIKEEKLEASAIIPAGIPTLALTLARAKWNLKFSLPTANVCKLERVGHTLFYGKREAVSLTTTENEAAVEWLRRQLLNLPEGITLGEVLQMNDFKIPDTPEHAAKALKALEEMELLTTGKIAEITQIRELISKGEC